MTPAVLCSSQGAYTQGALHLASSTGCLGGLDWWSLYCSFNHLKMFGAQLTLVSALHSSPEHFLNCPYHIQDPPCVQVCTYVLAFCACAVLHRYWKSLDLPGQPGRSL